MQQTLLSFNLIHEPWIPCRNMAGEECVLGLREIFQRAKKIREISDPSPLFRISMIRLLLSILYRTQKISSPSDWMTLSKNGLDQHAIRSHLEKFQGNFDLFSPKKPFMQRAELDLGDKARTPLTKFSPEFAAGNNKQLFDHSGDEEPPAMTSAEAARLLIITHGWSIGGGKSGGGRPNFTTAALARGASIIPLGENLEETLLRNLVPTGLLKSHPRAVAVGGGDDKPAWERAGSDSTEVRFFEGPSDYLTWQTRYIKLLPEEDGTVRFAYYVQGEKFAGSENSSALIDPFHAFFTAKDGAMITRTVSADRSSWRDAETLFSCFAHNDEAKEPTCCALAFLKQVIKQKYDPDLTHVIPVLVGGIAVPGGQPPPDLWCGDVFRIPTALLHDEEVFKLLVHLLQKARDAAQVLRSAVNFYASEFLKHENGFGDKDAARKFADSLSREADFWAALEVPFHQVLPHIADEIYSESGWLNAVKQSAINAFNSSLGSQDSTGRHLRALNAARGYFLSGKKGLYSIVPKEDDTNDTN